MSRIPDDVPTLAYIIARSMDKFASGWRRLTRALPRLLFSFYVDQNPDYGAAVLLAGSGRGGTTWLAEIINYDNSFRFMFEPFYGSKVWQSRNFGECQYLRPQNSDPTFLEPAQKVFSGRIRNGWIDAYNRKLKANQRLVKDIRINLMLGWIRAHFPKIPIILLLRHPCAVAYSRYREKWNSNLEAVFLSQTTLMEDFGQPISAAVQQAHSDFDRHIVWWCIENYVPLSQFSPGEILVTTYEDCVVSPKSEIQRIFDFLRKPFSDDVLRAVGKPSTQTRWNWRSRNASPIILGESIVDAWQRSVNQDDSQRAIEILQLFGLDAIYDGNPLPHTLNIERFMKASSRFGRLNDQGIQA